MIALTDKHRRKIAMFYKTLALLFLALLLSACEVVPLTPPPEPTPIPTLDPAQVNALQSQAQDKILNPVQGSIETLAESFEALETAPDAIPQGVEQTGAKETAEGAEEKLPQHGLRYALLPILLLGALSAITEVFLSRYLRPRSIDVTKILIKGQDGLFIESAVSVTARKTLSPTAVTTRWDQVSSFVEKEIEQRLINESIKSPTLNDLEHRLDQIAEGFRNLPIAQELANDFGVEVLRFNIETRYPQETMDALNRRAEASAGGTAYLAYAAAAGLNPNSAECRELYKVYQETSGQVDAARNLGGGITGLVTALSHRQEKTIEGKNVENE